MHEKIEEIIERIGENVYGEVVKRIMDIHHDRFIVEPAACSNHHDYMGGLLEHSFNTAITAHMLASRAEYYNDVNVGLVIAGAFLHDIGKLDCYAPVGPQTVLDHKKRRYDTTIENNLLHHIPIGYHIVASALEDVRASREDYVNLLHIIVSHHGRVEYSSPRRPKTDEAFIVSQADLFDAYMGANKWAKDKYNT